MTIGRFAVLGCCRADLSCPKLPLPDGLTMLLRVPPSNTYICGLSHSPQLSAAFCVPAILPSLNNHLELSRRPFGQFHGGSRTDALEFDDPPLLRRLTRPTFRCMLLQRKRRQAFIYNSTSTAAAPLIQTMIPSDSSMTQRLLATYKKKRI